MQRRWLIEYQLFNTLKGYSYSVRKYLRLSKLVIFYAFFALYLYFGMTNLVQTSEIPNFFEQIF